MVVSFHYVADSAPWSAKAPHGFPTPVYDLTRYGFLGVELFFLISGFVICMSGMGRGLGQFFVARVTRLYPAYWFAVIATTVVDVIYPYVRPAHSFRDVTTNLTMLQIPLHVGDVDGVYWTLWVEMRFYLLFAIVVFAGVTYRRVVAFCGLWTVGSIIAASTGSALLGTVLVPQSSPYFIAGMAFFLMHRFRPDPMLWGIVGISYLLAIHYLGVDPRIMHKFSGIPSWLGPGFITGFFVIMALVAYGKLAVTWRWLTTAGVLTYPLYLLHQDIGWAIISKLQHRVPAPVLAVSTLVAMLLLAWIVQRYVERPLARLLRAKLAPTVERYHLPRPIAPAAEHSTAPSHAPAAAIVVPAARAQAQDPSNITKAAR